MKTGYMRGFLFRGTALSYILLRTILSPAQSMPEQMTFLEEENRLRLGGVASTGFYDEGIVRDVYLEFGDPDFWEQMKANFGTDVYMLATLRYEDQILDSVAVAFKGQTSYQQAVKQGSEKLSFSVKLNEIIDGQDIDGYNNFNFNNAFQDASFMKEVLYARLSREMVPALKGNFIHLWINGENWGPYVNMQQVNGDYIEEWFPDKDGIRWRADAPADTQDPQTTVNSTEEPDERPGGGGQWGDGTAALNYHGEDASIYQQYYTLKDSDLDDPWTYLVRVCTQLNEIPLENLADSLEKYMDLDATLWFLAQEILFSDDDSYVHKGKMDYYLYVNEATELMVPLEFDGNSAMSLRNVEWSPFLNEEEVNYPLLNRLLAVPDLRQRYIAHARTFLNRVFDTEISSGIIDDYDELIRNLVLSDPKTDITAAEHDRLVSNLKSYIEQRRNFILSNEEFTAEAPSIAEVSHRSTGTAKAYQGVEDEVSVTAKVVHSAGMKEVRLHYGTGLDGPFITLPMNDAGTESDETAEDGIFSAQMPAFPAGTYVRYYLEAVAGDSANTISYMPEGAAYEVFAYRVVPEYSEETQLVINEFMASNGQTRADEAGEFDDWIEIHNLSSGTFDLEGCYLTDDGSDLLKWSFPDTAVGPGEYLIIWNDDDQDQGPLHTGFKLSAGGEEIILSDSLGKIIDQISFSEQERDISFGRWPNGTGDFFTMTPSFEAHNIWQLTGMEESADLEEFTLFPNPCRELLHIRHPGPDPGEISIYSVSGKLVYRSPYTETVDVSRFARGLYVVRCSSYSRIVSIY